MQLSSSTGEHPAERDRLALGAPGRGVLHRRRPPEPLHIGFDDPIASSWKAPEDLAASDGAGADVAPVADEVPVSTGDSADDSGDGDAISDDGDDSGDGGDEPGGLEDPGGDTDAEADAESDGDGEGDDNDSVADDASDEEEDDESDER